MNKNKALKVIVSLFLLLSFPMSVSANTMLTDTKNDMKYKGNKKLLEEGKNLSKKIGSGDYIVDVDTGELVKVEKKTKLDKGSGEIVTPNMASGGPYVSHQWVLNQAIDLLERDGYTSFPSELYLNYTSLMQGADWPDDYETWDLMEAHFYNPYTGLNYHGESDPTALTKYNYYMNQAKSGWYSNRDYAVKSLGIAMHYLADLTTPHHVHDATALNSYHTSWESYADDNKEDFYVSSGTHYGINGTNMQKYATDAAFYAYQYFDEADASIYDPKIDGDYPDYEKWYIAAERSYEYFINNTAAALKAFAQWKDI